MPDGADDSARCVLGADGNDGQRCAERKPGELSAVIAFEESIEVRSGAHESGNDGSDVDAGLCEFGVQSFGKADSRELGRAIRQQMRYRDLASD